MMTMPVRKPLAGPVFPAIHVPSSRQLPGWADKIGFFMVGYVNGKDVSTPALTDTFSAEHGPFQDVMRALETEPWHNFQWPRIAKVVTPNRCVLLYGWECVAGHWFLYPPVARISLRC